MGGYLAKSTELRQNKALQDQIKRCTLKDILECMKTINQGYQGSQFINLEEFEDIFGLLLDDPSESFLLLQNNQDIDGTVDVYESLALFLILSGESIDSKIDSIFKLFDFDHSGGLDTSELFMTLQSSARALCKFASVKSPSQKDLEKLTDVIFLSMDRNGDKKISPEEFLGWINENSEIQEFLLKYTGKQTLLNAQKRFKVIYSVFKSIFASLKKSPSSNQVPEKALREEVISKASKYVSSSQMGYLFQILKGDENNSMILEETYNLIIKGWSAFAALDYYSEEMLSITDLKVLLWIYEGMEPSEKLVKARMEHLDKDNSRTLSMEEWIADCVANKPSSKSTSHKARDLFDKLDADGSGSLSVEELKKVAMTNFEHYLSYTDDAEKKVLIKGMISSITEEIFNELKLVNNDTLEWMEFKNYMSIAETKHQKLKEFLDEHIKK